MKADEIEALKRENEALRKEVAELRRVQAEFTEAGGALWRKTAAGYEPTPYCPQCHSPLAGNPIPPPAWDCILCGRSSDQKKPPG